MSIYQRTQGLRYTVYRDQTPLNNKNKENTENRSNKNSIIMGDFNIDLAANTDNNYHNDFKDKLLEVLPLCGFVQIIKESTRNISSARPPLIDHIWMTNLYKLVQ